MSEQAQTRVAVDPAANDSKKGDTLKPIIRMTWRG